MKPEIFGVFPYDPNNVYPSETVVRTYKRRHAAERRADKLNETAYGTPETPQGYVVRKVWWKVAP